MPRGPRGERRPGDVIGAAVKVAKIATGEIEEDTGQDDGKVKAAAELGRKGGKAWAEKDDTGAAGGSSKKGSRDTTAYAVTLRLD
jgi:hypothetical protein